MGRNSATTTAPGQRHAQLSGLGLPAWDQKVASSNPVVDLSKAPKPKGVADPASTIVCYIYLFMRHL